MASGLPRYDPQTMRGISTPSSTRTCYYYDETDKNMPAPILSGSVLNLPCPATMTTTYGNSYHRVTSTCVDSADGNASMHSTARTRKSVTELIMGFEREATLANREPMERPPSSAVHNGKLGKLTFEPSKAMHDTDRTPWRTSTPPSSSSTLEADAEFWGVSAARIVYWLKQLPALFLLIIAAWILIGYQLSVVLPATVESGANVTSKHVELCGGSISELSTFEYVTAAGAVATAISAIIGAMRGNYRKRISSIRTVTVQCIWRAVFDVISVALAIPTVIFAIFVILQLHKEWPNALLLSDVLPVQCFTAVSRLLLNSCILAAAALVFLLSLFSFAFSVVALSELTNRHRSMRHTRASKFAYFHDIGIYDTPTDRY